MSSQPYLPQSQANYSDGEDAFFFPILFERYKKLVANATLRKNFYVVQQGACSPAVHTHPKGASFSENLLSQYESLLV